VDLRTLTVWPDQPPTFADAPQALPGETTTLESAWAVEADPLGTHFNPVRAPSAGDRGRTAAPDDVVRLKVAVEDKVGVDRAEVEYRVNDGPSRFETMFQAGGLARGEADHAFRLTGKVKDGDVLFYRLRAADNRKVATGSFASPGGARVPAEALEPQLIYHPAREKEQDRWFVLRIDRQAVPLLEQEIAAERDRVRRQLEAVQQKLRAERDHLGDVRRETRNLPRLTEEQARKVHAVHQENRAVRADLRALASEAAANPALQALANQAQDIAEAEMTRGDEALGRAQDPKLDEGWREGQFQKADRELASAQKRLDELTRLNDRLAQDRLDQMKMERLARQEEELARKTADLATRDPLKEPAAQKGLADVKSEQSRVADELKRLTDQSKLFQGALDAVRAEQATKLAEEATKLAQAQRDLTEAEKETFQKENNAQFAELARKQQDLADRAAQLARQTDPATRAAGAPPLRPEAAQQAADALKQADVAEALQRQEQAVRDLEKGADNLAQAAELSRDPKVAARQLARLQDQLLQKLMNQVKKTDVRVPVSEQLKDVQKEQDAIRQAAENLDLSQAPPAAQAVRKQAAEAARRAAESLKRELPVDAPQQMAQARQFLERLVGSLPSQEQRRQQALQDLNQLRRQQQDIARQAEQAARQADSPRPDARTRAQAARTLAEASRRQAEVAERLSKLDAQQQPARHESAQNALNKALDDLVRARTKDITSSQQAANRELDQLAQALAGRQAAEKTPPQQPAAPAQPAGPTPRQMAQQLAEQQRQLARATEKAQQQGARGVEARPALARLADDQG
jgi:hypothetical protein